jgi:cytochrome c5
MKKEMTGMMRWKYGAVAVLAALAGCGSGSGSVQEASGPSGETTYQQFCFSCHAAGVAGAPKVGDTAAWVPRIAAGEAVMLQRVIEGIAPGMPPRGLCSQCSDADLAAAIDYMVEQSE